MTMNEILESAPAVLLEFTRELVRRGAECAQVDSNSQESACLSLAIRAASLLLSMGVLLRPPCRDSVEVLCRAFLESRDLLMTFRFDQQGARNKVRYWFAGKDDPSWKPELKKCEEFLDKIGEGSSELGQRCSQMSALSHPTTYAATNSVSCVTLWASVPPRPDDFVAVMVPKIADYLTSISTLVVIATYELPGLISLGFDVTRLPLTEQFRENVKEVVLPILNSYADQSLPEGSYRS